MTEVQKVLSKCTIEGNVVKLPDGQLDRSLYLEVNKALAGIGGKWKGGKVFGFVFLNDPTELLARISGGEKLNLKKEFQFFATPTKLADKLVAYAEIKPSDTILEPSAGQGAIIKAINKITDTVPDCYELMDNNRDILLQTRFSFNLIGKDFLKNKAKYDKIIANPPFTKNQDITHVYKMYESLNKGGTLVSVMSCHWRTASTKKCVEFRTWLEEVDATGLDELAGTFKESGTNVASIVIVIHKK